MAEAILSGLVEAILGNLNSLVLQEFGSAWGVKKELEKLESTLSTIQAVLQDAEEQQIKSKSIGDWLGKLKDAAYDADDVLDEFLTEALHLKEKNRMINRVRNFFSLSNPIIFRFSMSYKIKVVMEKLDSVAAERSKFHLREGAAYKSHDYEERLQNDSVVNELEVHGREADKEKVVQSLISMDTQEDASVICVVGMGGIGKTTIAQLVCNDERVKTFFEQRIWVCVAEDFDVRNLTEAIIESITGTKCDILDMDPMQCRLEEVLKGRRFLLILDDVWNENHNKWDREKFIKMWCKRKQNYSNDSKHKSCYWNGHKGPISFRVFVGG